MGDLVLDWCMNGAMDQQRNMSIRAGARAIEIEDGISTSRETMMMMMVTMMVVDGLEQRYSATIGSRITLWLRFAPRKRPCSIVELKSDVGRLLFRTKQRQNDA